MSDTVSCNNCNYNENGLCILLFNVNTGRLGVETNPSYATHCSDYEVKSEGGKTNCQN